MSHTLSHDTPSGSVYIDKLIIRLSHLCIEDIEDILYVHYKAHPDSQIQNLNMYVAYVARLPLLDIAQFIIEHKIKF